MALGEYRPPNQISNDEDKYWKLTKTQIIYGMVGLALGSVVFAIMAFTGIMILQILGAICIVVFVLAGVAGGIFVIPDTKYLAGGGLRIDKYVFRKLKKKFSKKLHVLYTNNIDRDKIISYRSDGFAGQESRTSILEDLKQLFGG